MTAGLLLDTHVVLWLDSGDDQLRPSTRALIDGCWQNGGTIHLRNRLLTATAIELDCPLVTYDERILRFAADYGRQHGFAAVA